MYSSVAPQTVESQQQQARQREAELKVVEQAREESRKEVAALEQMKQHARTAFLSGSVATEEEFERCWPTLRDYMFRLQACHGVIRSWAAES